MFTEKEKMHLICALEERIKKIQTNVNMDFDIAVELISECRDLIKIINRR